MHRTAAVALVTVVALVTSARADEGMWLLNGLPLKQLRAKHDFSPDDAWTRHVMRAAVRMGSGGSGSFVSRDGLVLTNHHIASQHLQNISTPDRDYLRDGFLAASREQEVRVPGLELVSLRSIEDVTDRVTAAVTPRMTADAADKARKAAMATIERESLAKTGLRSDVVTLHGGFRFHLYRYQSYTDVRIAFAPEAAVGFFGGDPDNFEYPRYCLDMALFRVYEGGKPATVEHYLTWAAEGVSDGELVLVAGHPGRTERLLTAAALQYRRDTQLPYRLALAADREAGLLEYGKLGPEYARQAADNLFGTQNGLKVLRGQSRGLNEGSILGAKEQWERDTQKQVAGRPELKAYADIWDRVRAAHAELTALHPRVELLEDGGAFWSELFGHARTLVRLAAEDAKPDEQRLREYNDARRASLELKLFSGEPVYDRLETMKLGRSLEFMRLKLGEADPLVRRVLRRGLPGPRAAELVAGTRLRDVAERRRIRAGGQAAIDASDDTMIQLAAAVDPESRRLRALRESKADEPLLQAYADLSRLLFELEGPDRYPDATSTLRLSAGTVRGYEQDGIALGAWTTVGGTFDDEAAHGGKWPWRLPRRWHDARAALAGDTPFNFVSTADIVGGNSGSPTLNRRGELVGLVFDGNRYSLTDAYAYSEERRRAVHVDARAMRELMAKVYRADALLAEMGLAR